MDLSTYVLSKMSTDNINKIMAIKDDILMYIYGEIQKYI